MRRTTVLMIALVAAVCGAAEPQPVVPVGQLTTQDVARVTAEAVARWQAWRFGLFIHWGPASLTGNEISWSRGAEGQTPIAEYDELYQRFNPTLFDADAWARTARYAGMKYLVITAKHADGFSLWPSKFTSYHIGNTPFKRDVLKELSEACQRNGIQFCTYYCITDWYHPDYPLGSPGGRSRKPNPNMPRYAEFVKNQVGELMDHYGPLGVMWFDTGDAQTWAPENIHYGDEIYSLIKKRQPTLLVNDRVTSGRSHGGDFDTLGTEGRIGGFNRARPWETCTVIAGHWAWCPYAETHAMSLQECVQTLLRIVGNDGNFLLNVGPRADGRIEPLHVARLKEVGGWLAKYGDGVYGTRGGPFISGRWGASTCKDNKVYVFVMQWPKDVPLLLPAIAQKITAIRTLTGGSTEVKQDDRGVALSLPAADRDPIATIVELTVAGKAFDIPPVTALSFTQAQALAAPVPRAAGVSESLKRGRLALWHLDEGSGTVVRDSLPSQWNGTFTGAPKWADGKFGKALICDGHTWVNIGDASKKPLTNAVSLSLWVKPSDLAGAALADKGNACALGMGDGGVLAFKINGVDGKERYHCPADIIMLTPDAWHHVAATYDGSVMRVYIDGEEIGQGLEAKVAIQDSGALFRFGASFKGALDEVALYDRGLSREEVEALATAKTAEE